MPTPIASMFQPFDGIVATTATILVATDGTEQSDGALRMALARGDAMNAVVEVMAVATAEPVASPDMSFVVWSDANLARRSTLRASVELQLERVTGRPRVHPVVLLDGNPAFTISRVAIEHRAALIVVGLGRHNIADRLFSDETAVQLARISRVPVLAVPALAHTAPRHAVVAIDFSTLSVHAAQAAVDAVGTDGRVELVHVMPHVNEDPFSVEAQEPYQRWAEQQLSSLARHLVVENDVQVTCATVRGRPAPELLEYARTVGADLIVTGTHGRGFVARAFLGSVTTKLMRAATCSVLTVPRHPLPSPMTSDGADAPVHSEHTWSESLTAFTRRNLGRRTILEVDDLEIGAHSQEYNYPLVSAMYDAHDRRLTIRLGDHLETGRQLSRSMGDVSGVDVLTDEHGRDVALRVQHGGSQTLLTLTP